MPFINSFAVAVVPHQITRTLAIIVVGLIVSSLSAFANPIQEIQVFFYLENQTKRAITLRVSTDGRELFRRTVEAVKPPDRGKEEPPKANPGSEIKVPMNPQSARLKVEILADSRRERTFDIGGFAGGAGFRVVVTSGDIVVTQDYYPVR